MFFTKLKYISYGICISLVTTTLVTKAAGLNGVFGDYFTNMTLACSVNSIITGFESSGPSFGMRKCSTLQTILGSIFGSSTAPTGQAMLGFDVSGNPKYGSVNWNNNGSDISYTGSNVGIGTSTPTVKLDVNGNTKISGSIGIGSAGPENTNWGASIHKDYWAIVTRKADGGDNAEPQNSRGSIYTNDIYLRSTGKWVSQLGGGIPPGYTEVTTTYPDYVVGAGNPAGYNCSGYAGTNGSVQNLTLMGFAWGAPALGQPWYWGGVYYGSNIWSLTYAMAKTTETSMKKIKSVTPAGTYWYINDIRKGCGGDTIPFSGVGFTVKYYDTVQLVKFQ